MSIAARIKQFRTSFRFKLLLIFTSATFMISSALVAVFIGNQIHSYNGKLADRANLMATILANGVRIPLFSEDHATLMQRSTELLDSPRIARVTITGIDGKTVVDARSPKYSENTPVVSVSVPVSSSLTGPSADSALAGITSDAKTTLGTVTVAIDKSGLGKSIASSVALASILALAFSVMVISFSYPVLKRVTHSFQALIKGLDSMMAGNFSLKIPVESDDEAGRAAYAVNRLAEALEERDTENRNLQEELVRALKLEISEEKKRLMAKLIQTNRMTSLGLFVSSMAHNINTPNGAVKMAGQSLSRTWKDVVPVLDSVAKDEGDFVIGGLPLSIARDEMQKAAESVVHNADRIDRIINDLKCYSVGASWEFSPEISVNKAVEGGLSVIRAHGKHAAIPITPRLDLSIPNIRGNLYQLEQVVVNLLQNALLAMSPDAGGVTISTCYNKELGEVMIIVEDEGEGITKDALKSLDEPFISTRLDRGGSGLGLYISNFLVKEHQGKIDFQSESGKGTTVTVHLPTSNSCH